jgi:hypothetical protein
VIDQVNQRIDQLNQWLLGFFRWDLARRAPDTQHLYSLLYWETIACPVPDRSEWGDLPWPVWRFLRVIVGDSVRDPGLTARLMRATGKTEGAVNSARLRIRRQFLMYASSMPEGPGFKRLFGEPTQRQQILANWHACYGPDPKADLDTAFAECCRLLRPELDWIEAISQRIREDIESPRLIVAHSPPVSMAEMFTLGLGLLNAFESRDVMLVDELAEELLPLLHRRDRLPWLTIIPLPHPAALFDLTDALRLLSREGKSAVLLMEKLEPLDIWTDEGVLGAWPSPSTVHLQTLYQVSGQAPEDADDEDTRALGTVWESQQHAVLLETLWAFSALHKKAPVLLLEHITGLKKADILGAIATSEGRLVRDGERVVWVDERNAERRVFQFERFHATVGLYVRVFRQTLNWDPAARLDIILNLFRSMDLCGHYRLIRVVLERLEHPAGNAPGTAESEEEEDNSAPRPEASQSELDRMAAGERRLEWAEMLSHTGQFRRAHRWLLLLDVASDPELFARHQSLTVQILVRQFADGGLTSHFCCAQAVCDLLLQERVQSGMPVEDLHEHLAALYLSADQPDRALEVLGPSGNRRALSRSLRAAALAAQGRFAEADDESPDLGAPRGHQLPRREGETQYQFEQRWEVHVARLLGGRPPGPIVKALHQAAVHALSRGHRETAEKLIRRGLELAPDNVYLGLAHGKWLQANGKFAEAARWLYELKDELCGRENLAVLTAIWDATLKATGAKQKLHDSRWVDNLEHVYQPLTRGTPTKDQYHPPFFQYMVALNLKAYAAGVWGVPSELDRHVREVASFDTPPLLVLASKIVSVWDRNQALEWAARAVAKAERQDKVKALNHHAELLLLCDDIEAARKAVADSVALDSNNRYTQALARRFPA